MVESKKFRPHVHRSRNLDERECTRVLISAVQGLETMSDIETVVKALENCLSMEKASQAANSFNKILY